MPVGEMSGALNVVAFEGELNSIVKEYLEFSNLNKTLSSFEYECAESGKPISGSNRGIRPNQHLSDIQREMHDHFDNGRSREYFTLWNDYLSKNIRDTDSVAQKLEFYLQLYFAIYPVKNDIVISSDSPSPMTDFRSYLETRGSTLSQTTEFLPFYALPFVPNPKIHPSYRELFTDNWVVDLQMRLEKFLTLALKTTAQPRLFDLYKGVRGSEAQIEIQQLQQRLMESERKTMTYIRRHNKVQADYHNLIGITADLVDALEATIQGNPITPEELQQICMRLFANHMRQSADIRPGTAGDALRASVVPQRAGSAAPVVEFKQLDYEKMKQELASGTEKTKGLILQALRWRLTRCPPGVQRDEIMTAIIKNDCLGCSENGPYREVILNFMHSQSLLLKQYMARLLNTLASLCTGRGYLSNNPDLLKALMLNLRGDNKDTITSENILGCLQKLSLRRNLQSTMIDEGVVEWLVSVLEDNDALSDYTLEYSVALLMNLCLRTTGKKRCIGIAGQTLKVLSDLLGHDNQEIRPYVNGALYSILAIPSIKEQAKAMGMEEILKCFFKDDQPDMNRQIEFIIKQLNSGENVDDAESDDEDEDEEEEEQDVLEPDLDKDEILKAQPGDESGESFLTARFPCSVAELVKKKRPIDHVAAMDEPLQRPVTPSHQRRTDITANDTPTHKKIGQGDSSQQHPQNSRPSSRDDIVRPPTRTGSRTNSSSPNGNLRQMNRPSTEDGSGLKNGIRNSPRLTASQSSLQNSSNRHALSSKKGVEKSGNATTNEYTSAFSSRPRVLRTPDLGSQVSMLSEIPPQPTYSDTEPRPSSGGRITTPGSPRKMSTGSRGGSKQDTSTAS